MYALCTHGVLFVVVKGVLKIFGSYFRRLSNGVPAVDAAFLTCQVDQAELLGFAPYTLWVALTDVI